MEIAARNMTTKPGTVFFPQVLPPTTDLGPQVNFTIWLLTALSSVFLALRVYCKLARHRGLWWDDYILVASWLALAVNCAFISVCIRLGFGRPLTQFNPANLDVFLLLSNLAGSFAILATLWSKTSFALTVLRISSGWTKALVWFIIITVNAALGVAIAITWAQCTPIEKVWQPRLPGTCWPKMIQIHFNIFTSIYSGAMDIVLAVLPWKIIWSLTMNRKEKAGVLVAMSMGIFAGVTSFIKIIQLPSISNTSFTESTTQLVILGAAESAITIIAASIPILRALIRDTRSPPGPASFYHSLDLREVRNNNNFNNGLMYAGAGGRSSTVISSQSRSSRSSSSLGLWSTNKELSGGSTSSTASTLTTRLTLSRLSRFSGLSVLAAMGASSGTGGEGGAEGERNEHSARPSSLGRQPRVGGGDTSRGASGGISIEESLPPTPPPGKIVTTEEVVVEYEEGHNV